MRSILYTSLNYTGEKAKLTGATSPIQHQQRFKLLSNNVIIDS